MRKPHSDLGAFLRSRRGRLRPTEAGLPDLGGRRRVPGLRREELAGLAGISPGYYTRLEQGLSPRVSDAVLDAVARVLRLDATERAHLRALARPGAATPASGRLRPALRTLIDALDGTPALVLGHDTTVLGWNRLAHALLAPHRAATDTPHAAKLVFLDPEVRRLYGEGWEEKCRDTVADLRLLTGRHPDDPALAALIGELTAAGEPFTTLWHAHPVRVCARHTRVYQHPVTGPLTLADEQLPLPDDPGQRLFLWTAEPGSPSAHALGRLRKGLVQDAPETRS